MRFFRIFAFISVRRFSASVVRWSMKAHIPVILIGDIKGHRTHKSNQSTINSQLRHCSIGSHWQAPLSRSSSARRREFSFFLVRRGTWNSVKSECALRNYTAPTPTLALHWNELGLIACHTCRIFGFSFFAKISCRRSCNGCEGASKCCAAFVSLLPI